MLQKLLKANEFIEKNAQTVNQEYRNKFIIKRSITCFINIILTTASGDQCIGAMLKARI